MNTMKALVRHAIESFKNNPWTYIPIFLIYIALNILLIIILIRSVVNMIEIKPKTVPTLTLEERAETKRLHRKHGIIASQEDEWGREFFYRDGQRCELK